MTGCFDSLFGRGCLHELVRTQLLILNEPNHAPNALQIALANFVITTAPKTRFGNYSYPYHRQRMGKQHPVDVPANPVDGTNGRIAVISSVHISRITHHETATGKSTAWLVRKSGANNLCSIAENRAERRCAPSPRAILLDFLLLLSWPVTMGHPAFAARLLQEMHALRLLLQSNTVWMARCNGPRQIGFGQKR
jgi:hypothetical protein